MFGEEAKVDTVSPPRYTAPVAEPDAATSIPGKPVAGKASAMSDAELVDLLRRPPKSTLVLKTRVGFQEFFRGVSAQRMQSLLEQAYAEIEDTGERNAKIAKRMDLLQGVIS